MLLVSFASQAEVFPKMYSSSIQATMHSEVDSFIVSGNCGMCKRTIETATKSLTGVMEVSWNVDSKMFVVHFDPHTTSLDKIKQAIADSGYDTDTIKAKKTDYDGLPGCCQYDRK